MKAYAEKKSKSMCDRLAAANIGFLSDHLSFESQR